MTGISWKADSSGFYYSRYPLAEDGSGDDGKAVALYFHRLGDDVGVVPLAEGLQEHGVGLGRNVLQIVDS